MRSGIVVVLRFSAFKSTAVPHPGLSQGLDTGCDIWLRRISKLLLMILLLLILHIIVPLLAPSSTLLLQDLIFLIVLTLFVNSCKILHWVIIDW